MLDKENTGQTNMSKNDESDNTLHYSYSLLDGHPIKAASPESDTINSSPGDLSKSLFSETSSPMRDKAHSAIVDRFNGILYHEYHFVGRLLLCSLQMTCIMDSLMLLTKNFMPRKLVKVVQLYYSYQGKRMYSDNR